MIPYIVVYHLMTKMIRIIYQTDDTAFVESQLQENEAYQSYDNFQGYAGVSILRFDRLGNWLSFEEQLKQRLLPMDELYTDEQDYFNQMQNEYDKGHHYLNTQNTLHLIQESIKYAGANPKQASSPQVPQEAPEQNEIPVETYEEAPREPLEEPSELDLINFEIEQLEIQVGMEIVREMGRKKLLEGGNE
ncbi:MAG: hypothetical protein ACRC0X_02195 [Brevinema sp.]